MDYDDYVRTIADSRGMPLRRRLYRLLTPFRRTFALCSLLIVLQVALSTASPILLRYIIDDALPHRNTRELVLLCASMLVATVLATAMGVVLSILINRVGQEVVHRLRVVMYARVQRMSLTFFTAQSVSEVQTRIVSDIGGISSVVSLTAQTALAAVIQLAAGMVAMFYLNWLMAVIALAVAGVLAVVTERAARRRRVIARTLQSQTSTLMRTVSQDLDLPGVLMGRTMQQYGAQRQRFESVSARLSRLVRRQRLAGTGLRSTIAVTFAAMTPLLYLLAGTAAAGVSIGTVVVLSTLQARVNSPLQSLLGLGSAMAGVSAMLERTFEYLDLPAEVDLPRPAPPPPGPPPAIAVRDLEVRYPGEARLALDGVDVSFAPRRLTVLCGQTGSGKSTLALVITGQLAPTEGTVLVDGRPTAQEELWRYATLVPQETVLFNTTLRENLLFCAPHVGDAALYGALVQAGLQPLLDRLPEGLDAPVGERGYGLSGGERQRVGLARAILDRAPVLVADEPTSAVDNETAALLNTVLRDLSRERTVVLVTHRLPVFDGTQDVVLLADGAVAEQGRHADLVRADGPYARLFALQSSVPESPPVEVSALTAQLGG